MFSLDYVLKQGSENELVLRFRTSFRLFMFLFAALVAGSMAVAGPDPPGLAFLPPLFLLFFILAGLYDERWIMDREKRLLVHRNGFIPFTRIRSYRFDAIEALELDIFNTHKKIVRLSFLLADGSRKDVEISGKKNREEIEKRARRMATFMDLPFNTA